MSSDSSATFRADSGKPPAKRQKTFAYGPDIVFLQAFDDNGVFKTVAYVPGIRYREICNAIGSDPCYTITKCVDGVEIKEFKLMHHESYVKFYAHWINERNIEAALEICLPKNISWPLFACGVLRFWLDESLHDDLHDSMVDCIIERMQLRKQKNWSPVLLINVLYCSVETTERVSQIGTYFPQETKLSNLLAVLYLHHHKTELMGQNRICMGESRVLDLKHDIKTIAMSLLIEAASEGNFSKLPQDPLADNFDDHCRYHTHGKYETCYKEKQS
ncbi:hypothetical protein KCU93_g7782, partial [Aureobasidium melanogenum]